MFYIGIDPGKRGGIAIIRDNPEWHEAYPYSDLKLLQVSEMYETDSIVTVERVWGMPGQGISSTFRFGEEYGYIKGVLEAHDIEYYTAPPVTWKALYGLLKGSKQDSIELAKKLFPDVNLIPEGRRIESDGMAEALLLAEFGRRIRDTARKNNGTS